MSEIIIYRCTECGEVRNDIGSLHAHCERHRAFFGLLIPPWKIGDFDGLMEYTEILRVTDTEPAKLEDVREKGNAGILGRLRS